MVELLPQEQPVHRQSESARPNRAKIQKQLNEGSKRFCARLQSRIPLTSDVVLWPSSISTSTTTPPQASTISWPTTCSRV
jgi:hypothetical protein